MTSIEWTEKTWNPVTGCSKISDGCAHCYAEGVANRFWGDRPFTEVRFHPDRLEQPLKRKKPTMYFVNSMSDLFHESVTNEQLDQIFAVMTLTPHHTYQVLTKRPERMLEYFSDDRYALIAFSQAQLLEKGLIGIEEAILLPLPNVWLGVSVENQRSAYKRIPLLLQTPAAVRFLSCEPLLEDVDILSPIQRYWDQSSKSIRGFLFDGTENPDTGLHWCIAGGESGPKARPCHVAWIRSIVEQCKDAEVPCFVKQLGSIPQGLFVSKGERLSFSGKGNDPAEWPEDLRVREYPEPFAVTV